MRRCEYCGSELPDLTRFCGLCGRVLNSEIAQAVTGISTSPLPAPSDTYHDTNTGWTSIDATKTQQSSNSPGNEDDQQEEEHPLLLVDIAVPLTPASSVPMTPGTPSIGGVPIMSGGSPAGSAPIAPGTLSSGRTPITPGSLPAGSASSTLPPHMAPRTDQAPPHQPSTHQPSTHVPVSHHPPIHNPSTHEPSTKQPPTHQPSTHKPSSDPSRHTGKSSSDLHHSQPGLDKHEEPTSHEKRSHPPHEKSSVRHRRQAIKGKRAIVLIAVLLPVLIVAGGSLAFASVFSSSPAASFATVTITPTSRDLKNTYSIAVVTGTPDGSMNQVGGARILSTTTAANTRTVTATGQGTTPGTQAQGILSFRNPYSGTPRGVPVTYNAGTVFNDDPGNSPNVQMMIDATITVPGDGTEV